jgi:hypothetical protein
LFYLVFGTWVILIMVILLFSILFAINGYVGIGVLLYLITLSCIWYLSVSSLWAIFQENLFGIGISMKEYDSEVSGEESCQGDSEPVV